MSTQQLRDFVSLSLSASLSSVSSSKAFLSETDDGLSARGKKMENIKNGKQSSIAVSQSSLAKKMDEDKVSFRSIDSFKLGLHENTTTKNSSEPPRFAILLLGLGIRDSDVPSGAYNVSKEETARICKDMFNRHVVTPAEDVGYEVDFFAHSWNPEAEELMERIFKPVKSVYEEYSGPRSKPGFMNWLDWRPEHYYDLEKGVSMLSRYAEEENVNYEWVLVTRFDALFFAKLRLDVLDTDKFYVSNWCTLEKDAPVFKGNDKTCYQLKPFFVERKGAIPDFFSVASLDLTKKVYMGIIQAKKTGALIHIGGAVPNNTHSLLITVEAQITMVYYMVG